MATYLDRYRAARGESTTDDYPGKRTSYAEQWEQANRAAGALQDDLAAGMEQERHTLATWLKGIDPQVDNESGVRDLFLRGKMSLADTPDELAEIMNRQFGAGGWGRDSANNIVLSTETMRSQYGIETDKPVRVDEESLSLYDVADEAQDIPAIVASTVAGTALGGPGTGLGGFLRGVAGAGAAGAAGRGLVEGVEHLAGLNQESFEDVAGHIGGEAAASALGEGVAGLLGGTMRFAGAPRETLPFVTPLNSRQAHIRHMAKNMGLKVASSDIAPGGLSGAYTGMVRAIAGDSNFAHNLSRIDQVTRSLRGRFGNTGVTEPAFGQSVADAVGVARAELRDAADKAYPQLFRRFGGGGAVIPTRRLKDTAASLRADFVRNTQGQIQKESRATEAVLKWVDDLPDRMTAKEMHALGSRWKATVRKAGGDVDVDAHAMGDLIDAVRGSYMDADATPYMKRKLKKMDAWYKGEKERLYNDFVNRVAGDPRVAHAAAPEDLMAVVLDGNRKQMGRIDQLKAVLPPEKWKQVQELTMRQVLKSVLKRSDKEAGAWVLNPHGFRAALDKLGPERIKVLFDSEPGTAAAARAARASRKKGPLGGYREKGIGEMPLHVELDRLDKALTLVAPKSDSASSLVSRTVTLHPIKNAGRLTAIFTLAPLMTRPEVVRWLTIGFGAPRNSRIARQAWTAVDTALRSAVQTSMHSGDNTQ